MNSTATRHQERSWLTLRTGLQTSSLAWFTLLIGLLLSSEALAQPTIHTLNRASSRTQRLTGATATLGQRRPLSTIQATALRPQRSQVVRQLAAHLGEATAQELTHHLPPPVTQKIAAGLDRLQGTSEGRELRGLLRQAVSVLTQARQQAKTRPTQIAVARQLNQLGLVTSKMLEEGLLTRRDRVFGSERGTVQRFTVESPHSNSGFLFFQGNNLAQVHVTNGSRAASIRLSPTGVTRTINSEGTKEITEQTKGTSTFYYEREYTMAPGREKPVHVTTYKSKVDQNGKIIPRQRTFTIKEPGSAPQSTTEIITRLKIEDRAVH